MLKLLMLSVVVLYGAYCFATMPPQCFTLRFAATCQQVQIAAIPDWRAIDWNIVHKVRVIR